MSAGITLPMKAANLILAALFIVFAFLQVNDPDPVIWILIYGVVACACILAAFRYIIPRIWITVIAVLFAYGFLFIRGITGWINSDEKHLLFDEIAKMQYAWVEEAREFLGLLMCVVVLVIHLLQFRALKKRYIH